MYFHIFIISALLFFALSPDVLFKFPSNNSKYVIAFIHALCFGVIFVIAFKYYKELFLQEGKRIKGIKLGKGGHMKSEGKRQCYKKSKEQKNTCLKHAKNQDTRITCRETYRRARALCKGMI
jgi:hypothetical protein